MKAGLLFLVFFGLLGCQGRGSSADPTLFAYHTQNGALSPRRVVVVPLYRGPSVGPDAATLDQALATALRELGHFEVAVITRDQRDQHFGDPAQRLANVHTESLRQFRERHRADAILVGRVDHFSGYDPVSIGLECHLVSCRDGNALWSANAHFDGARDDIQRDLSFWYGHTVGQGLDGHEAWQLALQSPRLFCRYSADRLLGSLVGEQLSERRRYHRPNRRLNR